MGTLRAGLARRGIRRLGLVLVALAALLVAGALPAQALTRTPVQVAVDGALVDGIGYASNIDLGRSFGKAWLTVDERGGYQFSGLVYAGGAFSRHLQYSCTITYGPTREEFTVSTARYKVNMYKNWDWGRKWDSRIRDYWPQIVAGSASCTLRQG